jgi:hypothetical protein
LTELAFVAAVSVAGAEDVAAAVATGAGVVTGLDVAIATGALAGAVGATDDTGVGSVSLLASITGEGARDKSALAALSAETLSAIAVALKPGASAPIMYLPGFKFPTRYEPSGPDIADLMVRVSRFMMVIAALGTTFFDSSLTVPAIIPAGVCA